MMRYLYLIMLLFICGCKNNVYIEVVNVKNYAYILDEKQKIVKVNILYEIKNEEDVFNLYTKHQNYFGCGYHSPAHPNLDLINWYIVDDNVYYECNDFIRLSDVELFKQLIGYTNNLYSFNKPIILFNGNIL